MSVILCGIFFLSGFSALVFETLWFRQAGLAFGSSVWASSLVLSGFMAGLAVGNAVAARRGDRLGNPVRVYALIEAAIAAAGISLVYLLPILGRLLSPLMGPLLDRPLMLNPLRLGLSFLLLLVPSAAMGMTLPLLTRALSAVDPNFGSVLGKLYGWNTLGAVFGAVAAETVLIGALGVRGSAWFAGSLNVLAAVVALRLAGTAAADPAEPEVGSPPVEPAALLRGGRWLAAAFLAGFCLLCLEVVWFRFLSLFVVGRSAAFAILLGLVLAGIALGGLFAGRWLRSHPEAHVHAGPILLLSGLATVVTYRLFPGVLQSLGDAPAEAAFDVFLVSAPLILPASLLSGVFFTLAGAALRQRLRTAAATTGTLTLSNTVGAGLGALAGGFLFLPRFGIEASFFIVALLYLATGLLLLPRSGIAAKKAVALCVFCAAVTALFPFGEMGDRYVRRAADHWLGGGEGRLIAWEEGLNETILYMEHRRMGGRYYHRLATNAISMSGTLYEARRYMKLYVYLPVALHPNPENALLISYGVGSTAKALTDSGRYDSIDVVDISSEILEMNDIVFPDPGEHPLRQPGVCVHVEDGRYFLQNTDRLYDLITGEPPPPTMAGVVNLYSREYFELMRDRLAEGGVVTYWLPIHTLSEESSLAILRAFCDVFEDASLWHGMGPNLMMVGSRHLRGVETEADFSRQWGIPRVAAELKTLGFERPEQLGTLFIGDRRYLEEITRDTEPLVDDRPKRIARRSEEAEASRLYRSWLLDVGEARQRFRESPLIERLWPASLRERTLSFYAVQETVNRLSVAPKPPDDWHFEDLHGLLRYTGFQTPVLWLLGSDGDYQRIIADVTPEDLASPDYASRCDVQYHAAARLISRRRFEQALAPLERAGVHGDFRARATALRIYLLCTMRRTGEARALAGALFEERGERGPLAPYWSFLGGTFGIDPRTRQENDPAPPLLGGSGGRRGP